jgi:hypothetical protein
MIKYFPYNLINQIKISHYYKEKKFIWGLVTSGYSDFTIHKDEARKQRYINRHKNNKNWTKSGINTASWWSRWLW